MEEACRAIERTVRRGEGIALLFGASGTGKTLLLRLLRGLLETDYTVLMITNGHLETPKSFFQQLLYDLQLPFFGGDETELRLQLLHLARQDKTYVILIDESQFLSLSVLEEIRLLTNCDNGTAPSFRIVLAGNIEFEEKLTDPCLDAFNQRVVCRSYLETLSREETGQYIAWQTVSCHKQNEVPPALGLAEWIKHSGGDEERRIDSPHIRIAEPIFTENAKRQIFQLTDGLPRSINQLCDMALQIAAERILRQIDESLILYAWSKLQQTTAYSENENEPINESIESLSAVAPPLPFENIDEIVARKKATFQLKEFDSAVEFGTLNDAEPIEPAEQIEPIKSIESIKPVKSIELAESIEPSELMEPVDKEEVMVIRFRSPNEYKPPYPEDDHWEEAWTETNVTEINAEKEFSLLSLKQNEEPTCNISSEEIRETEEEQPDFYDDLDEILDDNVLFPAEDLPRLRELPISEELDDAIEMVAEAVAEKNITKIVEETEIDSEETVGERVGEERAGEIVTVWQSKRGYPFRRKRIKEDFARKYRCRTVVSTRKTETQPQSCCTFITVLFSLTRRSFDSGETWIGNDSFRPLHFSVLLSIPFRSIVSEPETPECSRDFVTTELVVMPEMDDTVREPVFDEVAVNLNRKNCFEESDMDQETLEKYGAEVLEGRPPFVRKEPNYAYQTTDSVPETVGKVPYPDLITGNVILLNWVKSEQETGFGTPYREFLSRETSGDHAAPGTFEKEKRTTNEEFDFSLVVRAALKESTDSFQSISVPQNQKTSLDESFEEIIAVEMKSVPQKEPPTPSIPLRPPFLNDFSLPNQIEAVVQRITKAAEKIEQAAIQSEDAGRKIKQTAGFIETEVKTVLPTYVELFRELAEFQQTITNELNTMVLENQITKEPTEHLNRQERPAKLLPFPVRMNVSSIRSAQFVSEIREISDESTSCEKSIDFQTLFQ
jgi:type II secretory pathway predicted ATPase ExeA